MELTNINEREANSLWRLWHQIGTDYPDWSDRLFINIKKCFIYRLFIRVNRGPLKMSWNLALSNLRPLDLGLTKDVAQMSHRKGEGHFNLWSYKVVWVLNSPWKGITWVSFRRIFKYSNGWVDNLEIILKFAVYVQIVEFKIERGSIKVQIVENKKAWGLWDYWGWVCRSQGFTDDWFVLMRSSGMGKLRMSSGKCRSY